MNYQPKVNNGIEEHIKQSLEYVNANKIRNTHYTGVHDSNYSSLGYNKMNG